MTTVRRGISFVVSVIVNFDAACSDTENRRGIRSRVSWCRRSVHSSSNTQDIHTRLLVLASENVTDGFFNYKYYSTTVQKCVYPSTWNQIVSDEIAQDVLFSSFSCNGPKKLYLVPGRSPPPSSLYY
jgi:hypothetical protein